MNRIALRWGDNDRYFGPFTYAPPTRNGYRALAVILGSGDDDDYPGCHLRLSAFGHTLIIRLPGWVLRPERKKVFPSWDEATIRRLGRNYYIDATNREYGFTLSEGLLMIKFGRQTYDSSTEQGWGFFLPWTQWRHIRHSLYGLDGELYYHVPHYRFDDPSRKHVTAISEACPAMVFSFRDFDGEGLSATTQIEEREWLFGTGWFKWLSLFTKPKVRRSLDIRFSEETGRRKGSWKGGTLGHGIDMLPGELHEAAFRRYCATHEMEFVGAAE